MDAAAHTVKKTIAAMTTNSKQLEEGIPAPYAEQKARAIRERKTLWDMVRLIDSSGTPWTSLVEHQKEFSDLVEREVPKDGSLYSSAASTANSMREAHKHVYGGHDERTVKMTGHAKALALEIEDIEREFKDLETTFSETQRYEKKVDKLAHKDGKEEKVVRNTGKLEGTRAAFQSKLDAVIHRMERAHDKYEDVMESAITAYWLRHGSMMKILDSHSGEARSNAEKVQDKVLNLDVSGHSASMVNPSAPAVDSRNTYDAPSPMSTSSSVAPTPTSDVGSTDMSVADAASRVAGASGMSRPKVVTTTVVVDADAVKGVNRT